MAIKKEDHTTEIKKLLDAGKIVIGTERTVKNLKAGHAKKVFLSKNCSDDMREDITRYAALNGVEVVSLEQSSDELGAMCRRPFGIAVLSVAKE